MVGLPSCGADSICNPFRVSSDAVNHHGGHREQEVQADEIEAGFARDDAAIVLRLAVGAEHRQVDPREAWMEPGAPHDVGDVEHPSVLEERQPISNAGDARHTRDTGRGQVAWLRADQRVRPRGATLCANLAAHWRRHRQHAVEHHAQHQPHEQQTRRQAVDAKRHVTGVASSHATSSCARAASSAISAPELPAPTTSTAPS